MIASSGHPLWGHALRQGQKGSSCSSSTGLNGHCIPQSGTKWTPFKYSNCYILMNHLKGLPIKGWGTSPIRIWVPGVMTDQPSVNCPCWMTSVDLLEISGGDTRASANSLVIGVNGHWILIQNIKIPIKWALQFKVFRKRKTCFLFPKSSIVFFHCPWQF